MSTCMVLCISIKDCRLFCRFLSASEAERPGDPAAMLSAEPSPEEVKSEGLQPQQQVWFGRGPNHVCRPANDMRAVPAIPNVCMMQDA